MAWHYIVHSPLLLRHNAVYLRRSFFVSTRACTSLQWGPRLKRGVGADRKRLRTWNSLHPLRTAVLSWGQAPWNLRRLSPKRGISTKNVISLINSSSRGKRIAYPSIAGGRSKQDLLLLIRIAIYTGICVYRRSYLIWPPVIPLVRKSMVKSCNYGGHPDLREVLLIVQNENAYSLNSPF